MAPHPGNRTPAEACHALPDLYWNLGRLSWQLCWCSWKCCPDSASPTSQAHSLGMPTQAARPISALPGESCGFGALLACTAPGGAVHTARSGTTVLPLSSTWFVCILILAVAAQIARAMLKLRLAAGCLLALSTLLSLSAAENTEIGERLTYRADRCWPAWRPAGRWHLRLRCRWLHSGGSVQQGPLRV